MTASGLVPILLVEDAPSLAQLYGAYLRKAGYPVELAETGQAAMESIRRQPPPLVLLDLNLPDMDGMDILRWINTEQYPTLVVVITAFGSINVAVEAMREGAYDFVVKPMAPDRLVVTVRNAMERLRLQKIVETWREDLNRDHYFGFIGASLAMQAVYRIIDSAAASKATVFITGESGTGKEVCAEAIHRRSPRATQPLVALNCGAIPKDLMESEIFGHVRGAFTGAVSDREGAAAQARGGTLFLDEVCELAPDLQTKLLRFVQTGTFQKVGGTRPEQADLRILCATNRDPLAEVRAGRFREDLYYRLHVIPVHLPPLRERDDDAVIIARHLLATYAQEEGKPFRRFDPDAEALLRAHPWPGNVRELQNVIRRAVVLYDGEVVTADMLPLERRPDDGSAPTDAGPANPVPVTGADGPLDAPAPAACAPATPVADWAPAARPDRVPSFNGATASGPAAAAAGSMARPIDVVAKPLWQIEKAAIEDAVAACDGNIPRAAARLGISASTIYRKKLAWEAEGRS